MNDSHMYYIKWEKPEEMSNDSEKAGLWTREISVYNSQGV